MINKENFNKVCFSGDILDISTENIYASEICFEENFTKLKTLNNHSNTYNYSYVSRGYIKINNCFQNFNIATNNENNIVLSLNIDITKNGLLVFQKNTKEEKNNIGLITSTGFNKLDLNDPKDLKQCLR